MDSRIITEEQSKYLLDIIQKDNIGYDFDKKKNQLIFLESQKIILSFRMPVTVISPEAYYFQPEDRANYVLIIIRSGQATVGYFEDGKVMDHKVFRAYMVRKKQGTSQIKYLKTKGKSRAGSRVRLAETLEFFENINTRLTTYFDNQHIDRIGMSCPATLVPYFYRSKVSTPFEKGDSRIFKIPKHVQQPSYESLLDINRFLLKGELKWIPGGEALLNYFLETLKAEKSPMPDSEDW